MEFLLRRRYYKHCRDKKEDGEPSVGDWQNPTGILHPRGVIGRELGEEKSELHRMDSFGWIQGPE